MKICTVDHMRNLDQRAIDEYGIPQEILMENAGQALFFQIIQNYAVKNKHYVFFCGVGNNGGDGLVVARKVHSNGGNTQVFLLNDPQKYKGAAKLNLQLAKKMGLNITHLKDIREAEKAIRNAEVVVDAIFGTGITRDVGGLYRQVIEAINKNANAVVSVDIPSGINGDNGKIMGAAIKADLTVTFGLAKFGNLLYPGYEHCGRLSVSHISFPPALYEQADFKAEISRPLPLPLRNPAGHKGDFGKALFIAGSAHYLGAPYFSALSFLKAGGGLAFLAAPDSVAPFIANQGREIIFIPQKQTKNGSLALCNKDALLEFSQNLAFIVIGPGLSLQEETQFLVQELATEIAKPLLIDGDGITAISRDLACLTDRKAPTILTPHIAEMSRLTQLSIREILENPVQIIQDTAQKLNSIIVLKGAHTLIGLPDGKVFLNLSGNNGMATAGSGDVLAGTIASMFGLGLSLSEAVKAGVFLHGYAGDLAVQDTGEDGLTATDILNYLPKAVKNYRENHKELIETFYHSIDII